jgi:hypothetical protein
VSLTVGRDLDLGARQPLLDQSGNLGWIHTVYIRRKWPPSLTHRPRTPNPI